MNFTKVPITKSIPLAEIKRGKIGLIDQHTARPSKCNNTRWMMKLMPNLIKPKVKENQDNK